MAALSGPVDPDRLVRGVAVLRGLGYEPVLADNLGERHTLFAGSDQRRLESFHRLADDPSIEAIIFARGGHGLLRLLPDLDWQRLAARPRAYVGYSDLTPLLLEINRRLGLVSFHGPMVAVDLARGLRGVEATSLLAALAGDYPRPMELEPAPDAGTESTVSGRLSGGCLSMVAELSGTPWAVDLRDSLFFWEDVDEPLYRLDRMLTHLRLSDSLNGVRAMILGHVEPTDIEPEGGSGGPESEEFGWLATLREGLAESGSTTPEFPIVRGLAAGHQAPNLTLPLGLTSRLEPAAGRLICGEG